MSTEEVRQKRHQRYLRDREEIRQGIRQPPQRNKAKDAERALARKARKIAEGTWTPTYQSPEQKAAISKRWRAANPERNREHARKRRARLRQVQIDLTLAEWERIKKDQGYRCFYCGLIPEKLTMDHKIPLSRGGPHTKNNVVASCLFCNMSKNAKTTEEYLAWKELNGVGRGSTLGSVHSVDQATENPRGGHRDDRPPSLP